MKNKMLNFFGCIVLILFNSCGSFPADIEKTVYNEGQGENGQPNQYTNQSAIVKDVLIELNKVRSDPKKYAEKILKPRLKYFEGKLYKAPGQIPIMTNEGAEAVRECINVLVKTGAMGNLELEKGLCSSAQWLADDQARTGKTGHYGSDGSSPFDRMNRYGKWLIRAGENCTYGPMTAEEIVVQLLIDDGVPDRGHRINILNKIFKKVGIGFNNKNKAPYGAVSVMDFAGDYQSQ